MTNRTVLVRLRLDPSAFIAGSKAAEAAIRNVHREIDKSNDRTAWLAQGILALTPAVTRLGAGAVPVLSGLATQMTVAVAAAGTMAIAFNGVGDALGALNDYQLDPTAENLQQLQDAMEKVGPAGEDLVRYLDSLGPALSGISNTARGEMFPGVIEGIESLMALAPQVQRIVGEIAGALGQLTAEAGEGLSSDRFADFFTYLETDAAPILVDMGRTMGNFVNGFTNMLVAFSPLSEDFSSGLLEMSRSFADWSAGLEQSKGFQEFVAYVREAGPQALDLLGSFVNAMVELAKAAAPLGAVAVEGLTVALDVLAALAATPLGPITLGILSLTAAWGRLNAIAAITGAGVVGQMTAGFRSQLATANLLRPSLREVGTSMLFAAHSQDTLKKSMQSGSKIAAESAKNAMLAKTQVAGFGKAVGPVAGQVALLGTAMSGLDNSLGLTNTTTLTLAGSMMGPLGAAAGASVGFLLDLRAVNDNVVASMTNLDAAMEALDYGRIEDALRDLNQAQAEHQGAMVGMMASNKALGTIYGWFADTSEEVAEKQDEAAAAMARAKEVAADTSSMTRLTRVVDDQTEALQANIAAMQAKRDAALAGLNADLDYAQALFNSRKAIEENGKAWSLTTEAGIENRRIVVAQAEAWNELNRTSGQTPAQARAARKALYDTAIALGASETEARRYSRSLLDIPSKVKTEVQLAHELAMAHARALKAQLDSIDRFIPVNIHVSRTGAGPDVFVSGGVRGRGSADGGTVPDSGRGYADRFLYLLADAEEVISNRRGQADRYRPVLKAINNDLPPSTIKGMLAEGGTAGDRRRRRGLEAVEDTETEAERQRREDREKRREKREEDRLAREEKAREQEEERREHEARLQEAILDGQQRAVETLMEAAEAQLQSAQQTAQVWQQAMDRAGAAAVAGFGSDLFSGSGAQRHGLWVGDNPGTSWRRALTGDIAGLTQRSGLITQLQGAGLTGSALEALLGQAGNADIAAMLAQGTVGEFGAMFSQREALQTAVSAQAGGAAYGAQYAAAMGQVATLGATVLALQQQLAVIAAQRPLTVYEAVSAQATAAEVARRQAMAGAA